jgi:hypothetical protein
VVAIARRTFNGDRVAHSIELRYEQVYINHLNISIEMRNEDIASGSSHINITSGYSSEPRERNVNSTNILLDPSDDTHVLFIASMWHCARFFNNEHAPWIKIRTRARNEKRNDHLVPTSPKNVAWPTESWPVLLNTKLQEVVMKNVKMKRCGYTGAKEVYLEDRLPCASPLE